MPVYIRTNVAWTPNSLREESFSINDDDFVQDPDQHKDHLPQPYRMIDKLVISLVDNVWEHVNSRESERIADASRFRPPQYECAVHVEAESTDQLDRAECISVTKDGQFVVIGSVNGMAVIAAESQKTVDIWADENLHITSLQTSLLSEGKHVISTIDDMGQARLYGLAGEKLYQLACLNEGNGENKVIVSLCEASADADYLNVYMEKPSSQTSWLEVHKLPKDAWIKDLDTLVAKAQPKESPQDESMESAQTTNGAQATGRSHDSTDEPRTQEHIVEGSSSGPDSGATSEETANPSSSTDDQVDTAVGTATVNNEKSSASQRGSTHKFAATTVHCKILPPPSQVTGVTNLQQAMKTLDTNCDVIGSGMNHLITVSHLEQREAVFRQEHEELLKYLPNDIQKPSPQPTCHFLQPGRIFPQGLENNNSTAAPSTLALWWSGGTQLLIYSLLKQAKELEHKPDAVFPLSTHIIASHVSCDCSKIVLALDNNNIVVWDMYLGTPKGVKYMGDDGKITAVTFLDPTICPQDNTEYPPYPMTTNYYVMVTMDTGHVFLVNCGHMSEPPKYVCLNIAKEDEIPVICQPVDGLPSLLLTSRRNGRVYLHDVLHGSQLCEITLPSEYELTSPWQPLVCVAGKGTMLYLKGQSKTPPQSSPTDDEPQGRQVAPPGGGIFVFQLRSFPALDKYRQMELQSVPYVVHSTISNRADALLRERITQQAMRVSRMQNRWSNLKREVDKIKKIQTDVEQKMQRNTYTPASIAKAPLKVSRYL